MKRFALLGIVAATTFAVLSFDSSSASAQQFIPQTFDGATPYYNQQQYDRHHTQTTPYWQAFGSYSPNYYANHNWPMQDYLPQQQYVPNGFFSNLFQSNDNWTPYSNRYQPIRSNPRSNQNRRVIRIRLR